MSDHDDSVAFLVDGFELLHDNVGGAGVKITSRLIGENDFGVADDSASDSNALLLTARELVGKIILALVEMKTFQSIGSVLELSGLGITGVDEWQSDIINDGEVFDKVEILKNEADFLGS